MVDRRCPAQTPFNEGLVAPAVGSSADGLQLSVPSRMLSTPESHLNQGHAQGLLTKEHKGPTISAQLQAILKSQSGS